MLSFTRYIELFEAKVDDLLAKHPEHADAIRAYNDADPTPTKKFLPWLTKQHIAGNVTPDDARLHTTLSNFDKFAHKLDSKDLHTYHYNDLATHIGNHVQSKMSQEGKASDVKRIYHEPETGITAQHIKTREAAQKLYGGGIRKGKSDGNACSTSWCVASRGQRNLFGNYGPEMHTIHVPGDNKAPYAVHAVQKGGVSVTSRHNDGDMEVSKAIQKYPHIKGAVEAIIKDSGTRLHKHLKDNPQHALGHPHIDVEHLRAAQDHPDVSVRTAAIQHPKATSEMIDRAQDDPSPTVRGLAVIYQKAALNNAQLMKAVKDKDERVVRSVADHPKLNDSHLKELLKSNNQDIKDAALHHRNLSPELRKIVHSDESNINVRLAKAKHVHTSKEELHALLKDPSQDVVTAVAKNPNIDHTHIDKILSLKPSHAADKTPHWNNDPAYHAMSHPNVSKENITKALSSKNEFVATAAIRHPNATAEHISQALTHPNPNVRSRALMHPEATAQHVKQGIQDSDAGVRRAAFASHHATIADHTHGLKHDPDVWVRSNNFDHLMSEDKANAAKHIQTALKDNYLAARAVTHSSVKGDQLNDVIKNGQATLAQEALRNKNITPEHLHTALKRPDGNFTVAAEAAARHKKATGDVLDRALAHPQFEVRSAAMKNKRATPEHIAVGLNDEHKNVRTNAIKNPNASHENIMHAVRDPLPSIAIQAINHPSATKDHAREGLIHKHDSVRSAAQAKLF